MSLERAKAIADAVLYEGYMLYPYRPSALKNRQRWTFGAVFPRAFGDVAGDASIQQTEVLARTGSDTRLNIHMRFLQIVMREIGRLAQPLIVSPHDREPTYVLVESIDIGGQRFMTFDEAIEREVMLSDLALHPVDGVNRTSAFAWGHERHIEYLRNETGEAEGVAIRTTLPLQGQVTVLAETVPDGADLVRETIRLENISRLAQGASRNRQLAQRQAFACAHAILHVSGGAFISLLDPPEELRGAAATCANQGVWPVLAGEEGTTDTMLASPIILYDYPSIAPESPGALFDGTEIDEILALRILALTEDEKREMAAADSRARKVLECCEALTPEQFAKLHGTFRDVPSVGQKPDLAVGAIVRLKPRAGGDILDIALRGRLATIEAIERDFEDRIHLAVTLLDDPGRDLGAAGFPGHRFFFAPEDVEPIGKGEPT
jgi:hydrogenase maturation protease